MGRHFNLEDQLEYKRKESIKMLTALKNNFSTAVNELESGSYDSLANPFNGGYVFLLQKALAQYEILQRATDDSAPTEKEKE